MMNLRIYLCLLVFGWQQLAAQDSLSWSLIEHDAVDYMTAVSKHAALFSGYRQQPFTIHTENHSYFKEEEYTTGKLSYGGVIYPGIMLRWDLYRDELVMLSPANYNIVLNNENFEFAEIYSYRIIYFRPNSVNDRSPSNNNIQMNSGDYILLLEKTKDAKYYPPAGNYIQLFSNENLLLLEKPTNELFSKDESNRIIYYFSLKTSFYLQKEDVYYKIKNRRTLLKTLGTHRKELKRFIRANELRYRQDAEKTVLQVVKEYDKLSR